jgi:hypothetical protein
MPLLIGPMFARGRTVERFRRSVLALVSMVAVALPVTTSVLDSSSAAGGTEPNATIRHDGMVLPATRSSLSAGYTTHVANPTEAQGTFVLPTFTCTREDQTFEMSINLEGSRSAVGEFSLSCELPGAPSHYEEVACADPGLCNQLMLDAAPGDTITITVTATASQDSATVDDLTTGAVTS